MGKEEHWRLLPFFFYPPPLLSFGRTKLIFFFTVTSTVLLFSNFPPSPVAVLVRAIRPQN